MPMSQLHLIDDLAYGGAQTQLKWLLGQAADEEAIIHVASCRSAIDTPIACSLRSKGITVSTLGRRFAKDPIAAIQLGRLIRKQKPEVIQTWDATSAKTMLTARRAGITTRWWHSVREFTGPKEASNLKFANRADRVIVTCEPLRKRFAELGLDDDKLQLVSNCFEVNKEPLATQAARQRLGLTSDAKVIVASIRMNSSERTKEAIWAADLVHVLHPMACLYLIGDGPARMACERFADKAAAPGAIQFLGDRNDLPTWLAAADVVWAPNESVGMATPMLEAMAAGKPLVAAKEQGRDSYIIQGQTGWLVDWDDRAGWTAATDRLLNDGALASQVGNAGQAAIAEFSADRVAITHRAFASQLDVACVTSAG